MTGRRRRSNAPWQEGAAEFLYTGGKVDSLALMLKSKVGRIWLTDKLPLPAIRKSGLRELQGRGSLRSAQFWW